MSLHRNSACHRIRSHPFCYRPPGTYSSLPSRPIQMRWCHRPLEASIQTSSLFYRSDLVFLLPPWPYPICLFNWRAWKPIPFRSTAQSYRCVPRFLARPTPLPDIRQRPPSLRPWGARGSVHWRYANFTVWQKRVSPSAHWFHGTYFRVSRHLVPFSRFKSQHGQNWTNLIRLSSKLPWLRSSLHSVSRGHDPWGPHGEEPWRSVRQAPYLGPSRVCPRQKKNATVSSSDCPTCVTKAHATFYQPLSEPWSSRTSDTVSLSLETVQIKTCNASKRSWTLRCALFLADENLTTYRTCEMSWAGLPPVSCTNSIPLAFYTNSLHRRARDSFLSPSSQFLSLFSVHPAGRRSVSPWGPRRVGVAFCSEQCSSTTACRRKWRACRWGVLSARSLIFYLDDSVLTTWVVILVCSTLFLFYIFDFIASFYFFIFILCVYVLWFTVF